jgi:hypothetical protein
MTALVVAQEEKVNRVELELLGDVPPNVAVSVRAPWDKVKDLADLSIPLRRPARTKPSREVEQEWSDIEAAKNALADTAGIVSYKDFRGKLKAGE